MVEMFSANETLVPSSPQLSLSPEDRHPGQLSFTIVKIMTTQIILMSLKSFLMLQGALVSQDDNYKDFNIDLKAYQAGGVYNNKYQQYVYTLMYSPISL